MKIKIEVSEDRCGNLELYPVNRRILHSCERQIIENHRKSCPQMHVEWRKGETEAWLLKQACAFFNGASQAYYEVIEGLRLSKSEQRDISHGWSVVKLVDRDLWDHYFRFSNGIE